MRARRRALDGVRRQPSTHIGLWLDRYLDEQNEQQTESDEGKGAKADHIRGVQGMPVPAGYTAALKRRREDLARLVDDGSALVIEAKAEGRIAIGLGEKGVLENGLRLEYTWGVPLLPGSALKGVCRRAAGTLIESKEWEETEVSRGDSHKALFGFTNPDGKQANIGKVDFLDAWWVPDGKQSTIPVHLDTMTVHHQKYYQGQEPPTDTDDPIPVPFATVSGTFLIALVLNRPTDPAEWLDAAAKLLQIGLTELGVGAKTNSGYGRVVFDLPGESGKGETAADARKRARDEQMAPEDLFDRDFAQIIASPGAQQADWLLEHAADFGHIKAHLKLRLAFGIEALRGRADGEDPRLGEKQAEIEAHTAKKPSKKKDKKGKLLKKWRKEETKLLAQLEQLQREGANREGDQEKAAQVLAWLDAD